MTDAENQDIYESLLAEAKRIHEGMGFDSIQIVATYTSGNNTISTTAGSGSWFARLGSVRNFLIRQDEQEREHVRRTYSDD